MLILWYSFLKKPFTAVKINDILTQAAENIISIFANSPVPIVPSLEYVDETNNSVLKAALLFY